MAHGHSAGQSVLVNPYLTLKVVSIYRTEDILIVTRKMLRERAFVLASHHGRAPHEACKMDWEQAKKEMCRIQASDTISHDAHRGNFTDQSFESP